MNEIKICCERLGNNIYGNNDHGWGITIDDHTHRNDFYKFSSLKPSDTICVLADSAEDQLMALFDIRCCPYCGSKLQTMKGVNKK